MENRMDAVEQRIGGLEVKAAKVLEQLEVMRAQLKYLQGISGDLDPPWKPTAIEEQIEEGWNEETEMDLNFQKVEDVVNHQNQKREEPEKNHNGGEVPTPYCGITTTETRSFHNSSEQLFSIETEESDLNKGKNELRPGGTPKLAEMDGGEEDSPKDALLKAPDRGTTMAKNGFGEIVVSRVTEVRERWDAEEMVRKSDRVVKMLRDDEHWGRPPEENAGGSTATGGEALTEEWSADDSEECVFSLAVVSCDTEREEKRSGGDGNAAETAPEEENDAAAVEERLACDFGVQRFRVFSLFVETRNRKEW